MSDLMQAAVAAALREAAEEIEAMRGPTDVPRTDKAAVFDEAADRCIEIVLALITPDAQAALDRVVAAERKRAYNAGRKHERDLIYVFAQRMDTEGKAYAEQILAAIRNGDTP